MLHHMKKLIEKGDRNFKFQVSTFNGSGRGGREMLDHMKKMIEKGDRNFKFQNSTFNGSGRGGREGSA